MARKTERHEVTGFEKFFMVDSEEVPNLAICTLDDMEGLLATEIWKRMSEPICVAMAGRVGVGKSMVKNVLSNARNSFLETFTTEKGVVVIRKSLDKYSGNIVYLDSTGFDPNKETLQEYFKRCAAADFHFLVTARSVTQFEIDYLKLAQSNGKQVFLVYSQIDKELRGVWQQYRSGYDEQFYLLQLGKRITEKLRSSNINNVQYFIVSSLQREKWDFTSLRHKISNDLLNLRIEVIISELTTLIKERIISKKGMLEKIADTAGKRIVARCVMSRPKSYFSNITRMISEHKELFEQELAVEYPTDAVELAMNSQRQLKLFKGVPYVPVFGTVPLCLFSHNCIDTIIQQLLNDGVKYAMLKWSFKIRDMVAEVMCVSIPKDFQGLNL